jgi:hypothetical protein
MPKIYRTAQFLVGEATNEQGEPWKKDIILFSDDADVLIAKYDEDHPIYKLKGKIKKSNADLDLLIDAAGESSNDKITVIVKNHKGQMNGDRSIKKEDPIFEIKTYNSKEELKDENAEYFIISDTFLRDTNDETTPDGILTMAESTFTFHLAKKVNQYYLIIINDNPGGGAGEPAGVGAKIPSN